MSSSDHFPEFDMLDKPLPKGILKNSNPNATYHKHHHRRKLEELVENGAEIISTTHNHHGRHRHHHKHHRHHSDESDQERNEKNRKHHGSSTSSKKKHHKHHHRHHRNEDLAANDSFAISDNNVEENSSSTSSSRSEGRNGTSDRKHRHQNKHVVRDRVHVQADDISANATTHEKESMMMMGVTAAAVEEQLTDNIYDCPKVPPVPVVVMSTNNSDKTTNDYQNGNSCNNSEALQTQKHPSNNNSATEVVYDVPRSNPRKVEKKQQNQQQSPKEAIYVNETFSEKIQNYPQEPTKINNVLATPDGTYDVPRTVVSNFYVVDTF